MDTLCKNSFPHFCRFYIDQKIGAMHREWIDEIQRPDKYLAVMSARGHFKTSILSVAFPLWVMYKEKKPKIFVILSASLEQSTEIMQLIKRKIEDRPQLREVLYPENTNTTKWSETQIRTKNGHRVLCLPFGDTVRGKHPDYCICDDVLKAEVSTDVEDAKRVFYGIVFPIVQARRGKLIVVGTPVSYTDLLFDLSTKPSFTFLRYPAVVFNDDGSWKSPQFPEHFSLEQLQQIKDTMPAHLWAREYLCNPLSEDTALFPPEVLRKATAKYKEYEKIYADTKHKQRYLGCDIAVSEGSRADWSVFTVLEKVAGCPYLVKDISRKHLTAENNLVEIRNLQTQYHFSKIIVEQTGVGWGVAEACTKDGELRAISIPFDTKALSKERIISRLEVILRNGGLCLPQNDILLQELGQYAYKRSRDGRMTYEGLGEHDDTVMSLALALEGAENSGVSSLNIV